LNIRSRQAMMRRYFPPHPMKHFAMPIGRFKPNSAKSCSIELQRLRPNFSNDLLYRFCWQWAMGAPQERRAEP
jgi:hypothetical protein